MVHFHLVVICVSPKIVVHLLKAPPKKPPGPSVLEKANCIRLSFRKGGQQEVNRSKVMGTSR